MITESIAHHEILRKIGLGRNLDVPAGGLWILLAASGIALYFGWRLFWFETDDAYIAFRYASNAMLGHGFVWNPPPFLPVEGYTSPLWVFLLTAVWRVFGVEPPDAANRLSLLCTALTLLVTTSLVLRLDLAPIWRRHRLALLAFVLFGCLTNRTFLAWSSSGLETAMFNLFTIAWFAAGLRWLANGRVPWLAATTGLASLATLARPDGVLFLAATIAVALARAARATERRPHAVAIAPALLVPAHLVWRRATYGAWVPNTYVAKHVEAWPQSGLIYLASFVLEYGLWIWGGVLIAALVVAMRRRERARSSAFGPAVLVVAFVAHAAYYTFVIGGDHFEYRVYSAFVPLLFVSFVWMLNRLPLSPLPASTLCALFLAVGLPIPWVHWHETHRLETREETFNMRVFVATALPWPVRWYGAAFDHLQRWLRYHGVCARHQEHKVFLETQLAEYPPREVGSRIRGDDLPVYDVASVGVPGWSMPHVCILDRLGLNDYVVARAAPYERPDRIMAHDRHPPPSYVESYAPNVTVVNRETRVRARPDAFDRKYFELVEAHWRDWLDTGRPPPPPPEELLLEILAAKKR